VIWLRWLVPRTLFGQIALIIILGIAGSQLVSVVLSLREFQRGGNEFFASIHGDRIVSFTGLFESLRPQDRESIASALSRMPFLIDVAVDRADVRPIALAQEGGAEAVQADLSRRMGRRHEVLVGAAVEAVTEEMIRKSDRSRFRRDLGPGPATGFGGTPMKFDREVRREPGSPPELIEGVRMKSEFGDRPRPPPKGDVAPPGSNWWSSMTRPRPSDLDVTSRRVMKAESATTPLIQVRLTDGTWLRFQSLMPTRVFSISPLLMFNWTLLLIAALIVSVIAAQLVIRPLKRLSNAADTLARDLNAPPLADRGPAEVRAAAAAFNRMHERLATYLNSRTRMLMAMSHDLKTPLTRLRLRSELLDEGEVSERIKSDLAEMESLVMSTLEYMRGSENREPPAAVEARALVSAICHDHPIWADKVSVEEGASIVVKTRPALLRRALSNLIDNAVRYGECAEVSLSSSASELTIRVRDHGPGVPRQHMEDVFKPFFRVEDSRNRATGGTGLGLAIAKEIVEAQGGRILLANLADGLEVKVILPMSSQNSAGN
jgi:signal transduction histidine kinase